MRTGPRPLMAHLGLALSASGQNSGLGSDQAVRMLEGIRKYQCHGYIRSLPALPVVWRAGEVMLQYAKASEGQGHPILLIPSMVNRATILDLIQGQSFVRWLADKGYDVYLLDWGDPVKDEVLRTEEALFAERLSPALTYIYDTTGRPVHILGYCMGGTLAAALVHLEQEKIASLTLLAAPWDFHAGDQTLKKWVTFWAPSGLSMIASGGYLPSDWIQTVFASIDPFQTSEKFARFAAMPDGDPKEPVFVAVEDWLNDPVNLPGELARVSIHDWFIANKTAQRNWTILGRVINGADVRVPVYIVTSSRDRLVPQETALAACTIFPQAETLVAACGHIGFMASARATQEVWSPIDLFLKKNSRR